MIGAFRKFLPGAVLLLALLHVPVLAQVSNWQSRGIRGGGALYKPCFNPANPDEMYAGCDMSGLFHSTDAGRDWEMLHFARIQGGNQVGVQFTNDPQVRYAVNYSNDAMTPKKGTDGGSTWTSLAQDPTSGGCWSMAVDPTHTTNLVVGDYSHLYYSSDGGQSFHLAYSTSGPGGAYVAGAYWSLPNIYVASSTKMLVSTDSGASFSTVPFSGIPAGQGLLSFAAAEQTDSVRFFGVAADTGNIYVGIWGSDYWNIAKGIYVLNPGQTQWQRRDHGITFGTDYPFYVAASAASAATAYVAGSGSYGSPSVFKSTDGGDTWIQTFQFQNNRNIHTGWCGSGGDRSWGYAECAMGLAVARRDPNRLAFSDYGFIHVSTDGGADWHQCYVTRATENPAGSNSSPGRLYEGVGLENTSCWDLLWTSPESIWAGFTDIEAIHSADGGRTWAHIPDLNLNTTYRIAEVASTGALYAALSSVHDMYQSTYLLDSRIDGGSGNVRFSTDRGASWAVLHNFAKPVLWVEPDPNRLCAAVANYTSRQGGIWVTNDLQDGAGSQWTKLPDPPRTQGHPCNIRVLNDGMLIASFSGRLDSTRHFTASSGVFTSSDSGQTWQDRSDPGMDYWTMDVVIDPHDGQQNTWYAGMFSGWGGSPNGLGGLYRTTNCGVSWTRINDLDQVGSCTVSPPTRTRCT